MRVEETSMKLHYLISFIAFALSATSAYADGFNTGWSFDLSSCPQFNQFTATPNFTAKGRNADTTTWATSAPTCQRMTTNSHFQKADFNNPTITSLGPPSGSTWCTSAMGCNDASTPPTLFTSNI